MKRLRLATPTEIETIRETSDLDASCIVIALDTTQGTSFAVIRTAIEVDPIYFPKEFTTKLKMIFMRDIETFLSAKGVSAYYFNILETDSDFQEIAKSWGAEKVSVEPESRFKVNL